ncbi:MAG: carotenoid biosynthesis protein [Micromonosporaceae bacterium]
MTVSLPARAPWRPLRWTPLALVVLLQIGYPLTAGPARATLVVVTVFVGYAVSAAHAFTTRGVRAGATLLAVTTGGGLAVEAIGLATGFPFGAYVYGAALGPRLLGVPVVVPLAWTWMAWPAWLAATHLVRRAAARIGLAALGLAGWDLFLDPQMVAAGYWRWTEPTAAGLPGAPGVPVRNHLAWLGVALLMMTLLAAAGGPRLGDVGPADTPLLWFYLWTYYSCVLAHAVFLGLPGSALWGGLGMGLVAVPLTLRLRR